MNIAQIRNGNVNTGAYLRHNGKKYAVRTVGGEGLTLVVASQYSNENALSIFIAFDSSDFNCLQVWEPASSGKRRFLKLEKRSSRNVPRR